jgi:hypothetical protein
MGVFSQAVYDEIFVCAKALVLASELHQQYRQKVNHLDYGADLPNIGILEHVDQPCSVHHQDDSYHASSQTLVREMLQQEAFLCVNV